MQHANTQPSRRRFLRITATVAGAVLAPFAVCAKMPGPVVWRGTALGALAEMHLNHPDPAVAGEAITAALREVHRLELIFSLYRPDAALAVLNRRGVLEAPPADLLALLGRCGEFHALSAGAFDPTVQPLWSLYADHFGAGGSPDGPAPAAIAAALGKVGFRHVRIGRDAVAFGRRGMGLTLNGIAQGYVTDCVAGLLRQAGFDHCLVDMGEARALGARPDGSPWRIGIADPADPARSGRTLGIVGQAVATSGGYGYRFDREGRFNHLLDPRSGRSAGRYRSVTTVMPTATEADALSTAFSLMSPEAIGDALKALGHGSAYLITAGGELLDLAA